MHRSGQNNTSNHNTTLSVSTLPLVLESLWCYLRMYPAVVVAAAVPVLVLHLKIQSGPQFLLAAVWVTETCVHWQCPSQFEREVT